MLIEPSSPCNFKIPMLSSALLPHVWLPRFPVQMRGLVHSLAHQNRRCTCNQWLRCSPPARTIQDEHRRNTKVCTQYKNT